MLADFIDANHDGIVARARDRVAARKSPRPSETELERGIPLFLRQLETALRVAVATDRIDHDQINETAREHGERLLELGVTIAHVVHDYGDLCQVITEMALEQDVPISTPEFRTLNLCLDDAIAQAVTRYSMRREEAIAASGTERLGVLAHELRNLLNTAMLSFEAIKTGRVAASGSTALVHGRSLVGLRNLIDRSLAEVRLEAGLEEIQRISAADLVEEAEIAGMIQAQFRDLHFSVTSVDRTVTVEGDRALLAAALSNLLSNAFKFTRDHGHVWLRTHATADRVLFEVEDECGGLPPGETEELFVPFAQRGTDRSGLGLGLSISLQAARASGGDIHVRNLPGRGCVFTLELARKPPPLASLAG